MKWLENPRGHRRLEIGAIRAARSCLISDLIPEASTREN